MRGGGLETGLVLAPPRFIGWPRGSAGGCGILHGSHGLAGGWRARPASVDPASRSPRFRRVESFGFSAIGLRPIDLTLPGVGLGATSIGRDRFRIEPDRLVVAGNRSI